MECMKRSMKYSLVFGICGCFVIPVIYEIYANVSRDIALWLFAAYVLAVLIAAALIFLLMYLVWLTRAGFKKAFEKFRSNGEKAKGYIENAFDDSKDEEP